MTKTTRRGFFGMLACFAAWRPGPQLRPLSLGKSVYVQQDGTVWRAMDYQGKWVWVQHEWKERT